MSPRAPNINSPAETQGDTPPEFGGVRLGKTLTGTLYFLLLASAAFALFAWRYPGGLPDGLAHAAPFLFLIFLVVFSFYRVGLMRARKYPVVKGFFQIGAGILFFMLLLPHGELHEQPPPSAPIAIDSALRDPDVRVRALGAELARYRPGGERYAPQLVRALQDPDPRVRQVAHASLVAIAGVDLGPPGDAAAVKAWRERFP